MKKNLIVDNKIDLFSNKKNINCLMFKLEIISIVVKSKKKNCKIIVSDLMNKFFFFNRYIIKMRVIL